MRRLQLLETTDFPHAPAALHESITEILALALRWGRYFHDVAPEFGRFLAASQADRVLDCASGAGDAITILVDALAASGRPRPDVLLTDLKPNIAALERVAGRYPSGVTFCPRPVDAAAVPRELWRPARTFINSLHHLPPPVVRGILSDCARSGSALFVLEAFPRRLPRGFPLIPSGAVAALANPLLCRRRRLQKALLTYVFPVIPPLILADMFVSVSRVHEPDELRALAAEAGLEGYRWHHGLVPFPLGGRASYFWGVPG